MRIVINPALITNITLVVLVVMGALLIAAYIMSRNNVCFTRIPEGTAKRIMRGDSFDHIIMVWSGHRLNDPRQLSYDTSQPAWEVLEMEDPSARPSPYAWWQVHWKFLAYFGIYWFGLSPFKRVYVETFSWTEPKIGDDGRPCPWHRTEPTDFIYVKPFSYWLRLVEAEDADNEPLNLDYLLTTRTNNPYKSTFKIGDWLNRITADSNNRGKVYVGKHKFDQIKRESEAQDGMSGLTVEVSTINTNLLTEPDRVGSPKSYGITIDAVSLVSVGTAGTVAGEVESALVAKRVATLNAEARVATAKGEAMATRVVALGQARAIKTKYGTVKKYGDLGEKLYQMDTLNEASKSPNTTFVWAANPFGNFKEWFGGKGPANSN